MLNYKNVNLKLLGLSLFTGVGFYNANPVPSKLSSTTNNSAFSFVHTVYTVGKINLESPVIGSERHINDSKLFLSLEENKQDLSTSANNYSNLLLASGQEERKYILDLTVSEKTDNSAENFSIKTIRTVFLYLLLLLFIIFGVFYPLFLFYMKLLNKERTDELVELDDTPELKPFTSFNSESLKEKTIVKNVRALVSQLQIAFAVEDNSLRQKLAELCSSVDSRTDRGIVELMKRTISLLMEQNEWTHVSYSSLLFPIERTKTEFESICIKEQNKFVSKNLSAANENKIAVEQTSEPINRNSTVYMVVTLALCTSHSQPLFEEIYTKNQLQEELSQLGEMHQDELIKFDLLWNPQSADRYLTNNELLLNYVDMIRLF